MELLAPRQQILSLGRRVFVFDRKFQSGRIGVCHSAQEDTS